MKGGRLIQAGVMLGLAAGLGLGMILTPFAQQAPGRGRVDRRVQHRKYEFTETNEQLPYSLFVSSKVRKEKKNPLIVSLHGIGGNQDTMVQTSFKAVELAEAGGYIYVAPLGYNFAGWYGIPAGRGSVRGAGAPGRGTGRGGRAPAGGGTAVTDDAKVRELSEKDVMAVLELVRKEFNIDDRRIYVMGHSMGGSGSLHLACKYPQIWAAVGAIAPPGAGGPGVAESLGMSKLPTIVIQGDADPAVPVSGTRAFIERLKAQKAVFEYIEEPGADHGTIISSHMADIFKFFTRNTKPAK